MKSFFKRLPKKLYVAVATVAIVAGTSAAAFAGFGPDRPTRVFTMQENGFDHVTFNSYTGVPNGIGDERDFFRGVQVGVNADWTDPVANVKADGEVMGKIWIHNDADPTLNASGVGVAKNVNVRVALPTGNSQTKQATAYIKADNATPKEVTDTLDMSGVSSSFLLDYMPGTGQIHNRDGSVVNMTAAQEQALLSGAGLNIGDQNGCFEFAREITFKLKSKTPQYNLAKQVRVNGTGPGNWKETVETQPGQTLDWSVVFNNTGSTQLDHVVLLDQVPANLTVVPGSIKIFDAPHPSGYAVSDTAIQNNGRQVNIDTGSYAPGSNAQLIFQTKVDAIDKLPCGNSTIVNEAYSTPKGQGTIKDTASAMVKGKDCTTTTPKAPVCNMLTLTQNGREVKAVVTFSANGKTFKNVTIDFGDKTAPVVTNSANNSSVTVTHTYGADVTSATVKASVVFDDQTVTDATNCVKSVSFTTPETPGTLPETGIGSMISVFVGVSAIAAVAYNVVMRRRAL